MNEWKELTKLELKQYFDDGLWHEEIADIFKISPRTVRNKVKKFGIVLPRKNAKEDKSGTCVVCGKNYKTTINPGYCSSNCLGKDNFDVEKSLEGIVATTELGKNILKARREGLSIREIADKLGCSKSTVSYYCSKQTRETQKEYKENNPFEVMLIKKIDNFKRDRYKYRDGGKLNYCKDWKKKTRTAVSRFRTGHKLKFNEEVMEKFTYKDAIDHLGGTMTKCYITGREIDMTKDDFNLDHIIPVSKGGSGELSNMGITLPQINSMKSDLELHEFFAFCKEILENNGYEVTEK